MNLLAYIKGRRRGRQANLIERRAMCDHFLGETLEGYDSLPGDHGPAIERMRRRVACAASVNTNPEVKKTAKADLQNKRWLFIQIGLAASLVLAVVVFRYSQKERETDKFDMGIAMAQQDIAEITMQDQSLAKSPEQTLNVISDVIEIVKNDVKVSESLDFSDFSEDAAVVAQTMVKEEAAANDELFIVVEEMPRFQGGDLNTFRTWVQARLVYPPVAAENGISGRVVLQFVVERDGSVDNIDVLQTPDPLLSNEAIRVLKTSPKWTAGRQRNSPVRVKYVLPVDFRIAR